MMTEAVANPGVVIQAGAASAGASASDAAASQREAISFRWDASPAPDAEGGRADRRPEDEAFAWTTSVTALARISKAVSPSLDMRIIGVSSSASPSNEALFALARRERRSRLAVIARDGVDISIAAASAADSHQPSPLTAARIRLVDAAAQLVRDSFPYDLVVAAADDAELLAALSHELAGDCWIASRTRLTVDGAESSPLGGFGGRDDHPRGAEAAAFAGAEALAVGGFLDAAARLKNAVLKTLEDNLHTAAAPIIAPYTRRCSNAEFIAAVKGRLGKRPARLPAVAFSTGTEEQVRRTHEGALRLVHSG